MHHQRHMCRQCTFYWGLGNLVYMPVLLLPLNEEKQYGAQESTQTSLVVK